MSPTDEKRDDGAPRACESCFRKKIRCDKKRPCSTCKATNTTCQSAPRRPKEPKQRVLISTTYERKIDHMDERLSGIEESLRMLVLQAGSSNNVRSASVWSPRDEESAFIPVRKGMCGEESEEDEEDEEDSSRSFADDQLNSKARPKTSGDDSGPTTSRSGTAFEGETSIKAQTTRATQILEDTLHIDDHAEQSPEMSAAFTNLRKLLAAQNRPLTLNELRFPGQREAQKVELSDLELPQTDLVLSILQRGQQKTPLVLVRFPCLDHGDFVEICKKVFFPTEPYTLGQYALAMAGLHILFSEFKDLAESAQQSEMLEKCADVCGTNFIVALSKYPLLVPPTLENIQTMFIAAEQAAELSRPSMAWMYVTVAAQLCLTLGYHRRNPAREDDLAKRRIFWFVYILERDISLQLGRSSQLQDDDINTLKPEPRIDSGFHSWDILVLRSIEIARIEGRIYKDLFCAAALSESLAVRVQRAKDLASDLHALYENEKEIKYENAFYKKYFELELELQRANFYSKLALIYQVLPPKMNTLTGVRSGYSDECVTAARTSLSIHRKLVSRFTGVISNLMTFYAEWGVLGHPFIAFTVVFSQAITTLDTDDLDALSETVAIMERAKKSCAKIAHLHHVCFVLHRVAKVYIEDRLAKMMEGQSTGTGNRNGNPVLDPIHGQLFRAAGAGGSGVANAGLSGSNGGVHGGNNSSNLFAMPPGSSAMDAATITRESGVGGNANGIAASLASGDPAALGFVNGAGGVIMSAVAHTGGMEHVRGLGVANYVPDIHGGAYAGVGPGAGPGADANVGIGGGRFLDDPSLSMMEMGEPPSFGWLPTGQDMVGLLDTDMGMFDI